MFSHDLIFVLNCGSSSLKFAIIDNIKKTTHLSGLAECLGLSHAKIKWSLNGKQEEATLTQGATHVEALTFIVDEILAKNPQLKNNIQAIGHRIAHGGELYTQSSVIDESVLEGIKAVSHFAPLHNPANLLGINAAMDVFPHLKSKNVAVFDTAFHTSMPKEAYLYPLPKELYVQHGIRRYGFHGTSHYYVSLEAAKLLNKPIDKVNLITCHLGNGGSVTAIKQGKSVDTSMGFTPLEGLTMGTRCGDIDPAIILFLCEKLKFSIEDVNNLLNKQSGLLGLTGISSDCRYLIDNNEDARHALNIYVHRLAKYIGGYSTVLDNQLDAIVFTGGIGENAEMVRRLTLQRLGILGIKLDQQKNLAARFGNSGCITSPCSVLPVFVVPTNEEGVIAQNTASLVH